MFKRSLDNCHQMNYDYNSVGKERCWSEREDYYNCIYRGKERRFMTIFAHYNKQDGAERNFVKFKHEWEKKYSSLDGGDIAERAKIIKAEYEADGLRGAKYFGDLD